MRGKKYNKILTIILVFLILGIISSVGYIVYDKFVTKARINKAEEVVEEFSKNALKIKKKTTSNSTEEEINEEILEEMSKANENVNKINEASETQQGQKTYMEGFEVKGTINITKTGVSFPILSEVTKKSLETSVAILYPPNAELNQPGNVTIAGHNYRNKLFFSGNKKLVVGDSILITDQSGTTVTYIIYDTFITPFSDTSYMTRDTEGRREISLSTCTDASDENRLIILAREK